MGKKSYSCDKCGKSFKQKSHYDKHCQRKTPCDKTYKSIDEIIDKKVDEKLKLLLSVENLNNNKNNSENSENNNKNNSENSENINKIITENSENINKIITENSENKLNMKTAISLFSGMGGDSHGIINAGYKLLAYSEFVECFRKSHDLNFKDCKLLGASYKSDISKIPDEEFLEYQDKVDLLFAGFPCQGFSQAGKKLPDDPRNTLFREFLRATKLIRPKYIIGENVKGLLSRKNHEGVKYIDIIVGEFEKLDYNIEYKVMKANLHGVPQNRHRLIIVGISKDIATDKPYEFPEEIVDESLNLKNIVTYSMEGAIKMEKDDFDFSTIPDECILKNMECIKEEIIEGNGKPHPNLKLLAKQRDYVYNDKPYPHRLNFGKRIPVGGEIIDIRKPLNTIICTYARQPRFFVPLQNKNGYYLRCLLPDELKQIQGFPADFQIHGDSGKKIIQIGNAVPPPLIQTVINNLYL